LVVVMARALWVRISCCASAARCACLAAERGARRTARDHPARPGRDAGRRASSGFDSMI
jgi:hypothetical protein